MLKILKSIRISIFVLILFNPSVIAKEITNLSWEKSVHVGKELSNYRETVTSPALGKKAWKITLLPRDCGNDGSKYSDCQNNGKDALLDMEEVIELEVNIHQIRDIPEKNGFQLVFIYLMILNLLNQLALHFFKFMNGEKKMNKDIQE